MGDERRPTARPPPRHPAGSDLPAPARTGDTGAVWGAIKQLRDRVRELELARDRQHDEAQVERDKTIEAVKSHVEQAVDPVRQNVSQVLARVMAQDAREAERERIKAELRKEQDEERKRVQEEVDRQLSRTGQFIKLGAERDAVIDARIDGTRKHKLAKWGLVGTILATIAGLIIAVLRSYAGPQDKP